MEVVNGKSLVGAPHEFLDIVLAKFGAVKRALTLA